MTTALAKVLYRWRWWLTALIAIGAVALASRADITNLDNDLSAWFSRGDPVFRDYERFREEFGGTRTLIVAIAGDRLFTREGLDFLRSVSAEIERIPTVQRVQSLATANIVTAIPPVPRSGAAGPDEATGGLEVRPLLERADADPAVVRARALADPLLRGDLVSDDGSVTAVVVGFDEDRIDEVRAEVIERIRAVVESRLPPGLRAYYNGSIEISETYNRITLENQRTFIPPILAFTLLAIYGMFRSFSRTIVTMAAIAVSILWTLGLYSLLGFTYNVLSSMIVPLVVVLAIADDVHIIQHYNEARRRLGDHARAFHDTVAHLAVPLLGASGTTALGMLSLATSNVVAVRTFGIGAAVGVMVDFALSLVFVPTLLGLTTPGREAAPQERYLLEPMARIAGFASRRPRTIAVAALLVALAAIAGVFRLRVDTNHINFFSARHPLHQSADVIDTKLSGVYSFQIFLEGPPESLKHPSMLARMDRLATELEALPFVRKVTSVADYVKRVNRELHDGRPDAETVPPNAELVAQELFVFSLSDGGRRELERVVASDYSRAQMSIKLASMSSDLVFEQIHATERLAREAFAGTAVTPTVTGGGRLWSTLDHYLVVSQLSSFATAFITIFAVMFLIFRSARFGLLAMLPNVFPVLAILGMMGWLGISMNVATIMVASVALGVVDDDTIHFISRYRRETAAGRTTDEAIQTATMHEGRASLTTAVINSCAYGVLMFSEYRPTAWFGGLLALTMVVAFLAEVFITPAAIKLLPRWFDAARLRERRAAA